MSYTFKDAVKGLRKFGKGVVPDKPKDDWIRYHGEGDHPVNDAIVEVELFDGVKSKGSASSFCWWNLAYGSALDDVKYYRIILGDEVNMSVEEKVDLGLRPGEVLRMPNSPEEKNVRDFNIGDSDYAEHKIQPWDIWLEYELNPWDADIVKRTLRDKKSDTRRLDYEKIKHICDERIRQIDAGEDK